MASVVQTVESTSKQTASAVLKAFLVACSLLSDEGMLWMVTSGRAVGECTGEVGWRAQSTGPEGPGEGAGGDI